MAHRFRFWIALLSAAIAAPSPGALGQERAPTNASLSSPQTQTQPADAVHAQIKELLNNCNEEINLHGNFQRAAEYAEQARELSQKAGDKSTEAWAMVYLGAALGYQGRLNEAYDVAQQTLTVARESGDNKVVEQALNNMGSNAGGLGRYEESVANFYMCLDLAREIHDPVMEYMSLLNIGEAYSRSGEPDRAEDPLKKALKLAGELDRGDPASKARSKKGTEMALLNLGGMEMARGHFAAALRYFEQVHASQPETPLWAISALQGMANANQFLGKPQEAIPLFQQALALAEKSSGGAQIVDITSNLGLSQEATGELDAALASQYRSLKMLHDAGGDPDTEWQIESHIGHVLRAMGRNEEALEHYRDSIAGIERLRSVALNTEEGRAGVLAKSHDTYTETTDLLVEMHRDSEAFAIAERGRGRAFLDMLTLARDLPDELTPERAKNEDALMRRISSVQKELWKQDLTAKEIQQRKAALSSAEEDLEAFRVEVRRSNPRYASIRYPEPLDLGRVQRDLLDKNTVLLEFLLGAKRSLVWVVSRDALFVASLPPRQAIEKQVAQYRRLLGEKASFLTVYSSMDKIGRQGIALYTTLLAPVRHAIPSGRKLIVVPDGALNYLPFETLVTGSERDSSGEIWPKYLLQKYSITYAPSASALLAVRTMNSQQKHWDKTLLAFGDPVLQQIGKAAPSTGAAHSSDHVAAIRTAYDYSERGFSMARIPFTREEVLGIAKLFPAARRQLYLGLDATERAIKNEDVGQYRYIHFATHGFFDEAAPSRSGILFSRDAESRQIGVLQAGEIMRLRLNADMVTLSACSTGLGQLVNGEGILGLTRAFFYAGARNLTVSLWNVNDSATSALMKTFYARLNDGSAQSEALRQAKLQLLKGPDMAWRNPYFWGAFVLIGEGK